MDLDDLIPKKPEDYEIGSDLSEWSVDELKALISKLESEIRRVNTEIKSKESIKNSADSVFKNP